MDPEELLKTDLVTQGQPECVNLPPYQELPPWGGSRPAKESSLTLDTDIMLSLITWVPEEAQPFNTMAADISRWSKGATCRTSIYIYIKSSDLSILY
jgi:hypothetical protein